MWTLCLTCDKIRKVIQISPEATVGELWQRAASESWSSSSSSASSTTIQLSAGIPPKIIAAQAAAAASESGAESSSNLQQTLVEAGLHNQDRIRVTLVPLATTTTTTKTKNKVRSKTAVAAAAATNQKKMTTPSKRKRSKQQQDDESEEEEEAKKDDADEAMKQDDTASSSLPTRSRSKRQAAQRATDSFALTMAAQDALQRQEQKKSATTARKTKSNASPKKNTSSTAPKPARQFTQTAGRRLLDGAEVVPAASPSRRRKRGNEESLQQEQDPSLALMDALSGGGGGTAGRLLRAGYRQAVENAYEQNKSVARLAAIPHAVTLQRRGPDGKILEDDDDRTNNHEAENDDILLQPGTTLHVTFAKGVQGKGTFEEDVDYLPRSVLQNVITAIHPVNPEALRPENLALLSPRVLWSIVFHATTNTTTTTTTLRRQNQNTTSTFIATALQELCPTLDWTFLRRRKQSLSAKARENLRQQQEKEASNNNNAADWEAAAAAIASVEQAMDQLSSLTANNNNNNNQPNQPESAEQELSANPIVTPTEPDEEELQTCLEEGPVWENMTTCTLQDLIRRLQQDCGIYNWRQLANAKADDPIFLQKLQLLSSDDQRSQNTDYIQQQVQAWIDRAQQESIDEIMVELCDGHVHVVQALAEHARSATPRDLSAWKWIVTDLHETLQPYYDANNNHDDDVDDVQCPTVAELAKYCRQAEMCLEQFDWIGAFVTPIAD